MAVITRVYTPANIHQGPADIYIGITAPPSSLLPTADANTLTLSATGEPTSSTGFHAGLVEAPTMPTITEKTNEIHADQIEMGVDIGFDSIEAEIDFVLKETNLSHLSTLITASGLSTYTGLAAQQVLQVGGQFTCGAGSVSVLAVSPNRAAAGKFFYWMLYKAVLMSAIPFTFQRSKETVYKLKFHGFADVTRVAGDELMAICKQK